MAASAAGAQDALTDVTTALSAPILRVETTKEGDQFAFDWRPMRYDFSGPWTGATDYTLLAERDDGDQINGWSGQYTLDPASLTYPVEVAAFVPELGVFMIRARCAQGPCAAMSGTRLGWSRIETDPNRLSRPDLWESFANETNSIIFAVGDCDTAHRIAAQMDFLLQVQGAFEGPPVERVPCPDSLQLASLD